MKKITITSCLLFAFILTKAQTTRFGIEGGVNLSNQSGTAYPVNLDSKYLTGFNLGGIVDVAFGNFSIRPGLFFSTRGEKIPLQLADGNGQNIRTSSSKSTLNYLQLPVTFFYTIPFTNTVNFHFGAGPYLGYGISASNNTDGKSYPVAFNKSSGQADNYKNPDYGVNVILGIQLKDSFIIDAGYSLGLANISYYSYTLKNSAISFSVGYLFK